MLNTQDEHNCNRLKKIGLNAKWDKKSNTCQVKHLDKLPAFGEPSRTRFEDSISELNDTIATVSEVNGVRPMGVPKLKNKEEFSDFVEIWSHSNKQGSFDSEEPEKDIKNLKKFLDSQIESIKTVNRLRDEEGRQDY